MSDFEVIAAFGVALLVLLVVLLLTRKTKPAPPASTTDQDRSVIADTAPKNAILVDGSNVMHWGGEPAAFVVERVVAALAREGWVPYVCFDANAGYKLEGRYMKARDMASLIGIPAARILVVDKGMVADEVLLHEAQKRGLKIVSNDRFRDWTGQHPWVKDHKRFLRGTWKEGAVVWQSGKKR